MSGHCYFGHNLKISSDAFPWGCDARHQPGGCKCGDGTSRFTAGKTRWRCDICDFDYCGPCYDSKASPVPAPAPAPAPAPSHPDDDLCIVCLTNPKNATLVHDDETGHLCVCLTCGKSLKATGHRCPMCRKSIEAVIKTHH